MIVPADATRAELVKKAEECENKAKHEAEPLASQLKAEAKAFRALAGTLGTGVWTGGIHDFATQREPNSLRKAKGQLEEGTQRSLTRRQPPIGITVIAVLQLIGALFFGVLAIACVAVLKRNIFGPDHVVLLAAGMSIALGALGIGLWKLRPMARYFTLILCPFELLPAPIFLAAAISQRDAAALIGVLAGVGLAAWISWYLFRPNVKAAFQATSD